MTILNYNLKAGTILSVFISASVLFSMSSCSKKLTFAISTVVPAATGKVKITTDNNDNYSINVSLKHLAPSDRLTPPRETYIVWIETTSNGVKNIGQIKTSNKNLKGSLRANIPFKPDYVFITAEDSQTVQKPGDAIILTTK